MKNKGSLLMLDRYTVLVLLQISSHLPLGRPTAKGNSQKYGKACKYLEYIVAEINIFHMRFWTRGSVTLQHTGKKKNQKSNKQLSGMFLVLNGVKFTRTTWRL